MASRRQAGGSKRGGADRSQAIEIIGLAQFRRDLAKIDKDLSKEINKYFRVEAKRMRDVARARTPVGKTGNLRKSIKHSVKAKELSLYSTLAYAPAHEWGTSGKPGTRVKPRGVPIKIKRSQMIGSSIYSELDNIEKYLTGLVPHLARMNGFDD